MKKILIMYARYGSGHKSIAESVYNYIKGHNENIQIKLLDMTEYANGIGKITVNCMDYVCTKRASKLFNFGYNMLNHRMLTRYNNKIARKCYDNGLLKNVIKDFNPDVTISTHFFCSNIIYYYNQINLINTKIYTIITDYAYHEFWIKNYKHEDGFIVANDIVKNSLITRGVDENKIFAYGLPLNITNMALLEDRDTILKRYNLPGTKKVYLFFGGSSAGSMYYFDYFKAILKLKLNADIIFICGKNNELKDKCDKYVKANNIKDIIVLGFTSDVFNLMKISEIVISKPGGATVTECLEMHKPMILIPGLGGQENYNAKFMKKNGYGIKINNIWAFKRTLLELEYAPSIISKMEYNLNKQDKNEAIKKINDLVMEDDYE